METSNAGTLSSLPDEALLLIFEYLSPKQKLQLESVCKRWQKLLKDSWIHIKTFDLRSLSDGNRPYWVVPPEKVITALQRCSPYVQSLSFDLWLECDENMEIILYRLARMDWPSLKELDLRNIELSQTSILSIGQLSQLESLDITVWKINQAVLSEVFRSLSSLKKISVRRLSIETARSMEHLAYTLEEIRVVGPESVVDVSKIFTSGLRQNLTKFYCPNRAVPLQMLLDGAPNLRLLNSEWIRADYGENFSTFSKFNKLEELYLNGFWPWEIELFLQCIPSFQFRSVLQVFHVTSSTQNLASLSLRNISYFTALKEFSLEPAANGVCIKLTTGDLEHILCSCIDLERLYLPQNHTLDDSGLETIGRLCPNLTHLDICGSDGTAAQFPLSNRGLLALVHGVFSSETRDPQRHLTIKIQKCPGITLNSEDGAQLSSYGDKLEIQG